MRITNNSDGSILVEPVKKYNESTLKISQRTAVHCETEELADKVLDIAHNLGYKWCSGGSFKDDNKYWCDKSDTCYNLNDGLRCPLSFYKDNDYKVISAIDFINLHNNERLLNAIEQMLKNCKISNTKAIKKDNGSVLLRCIDYKTDSPLKISPKTVICCNTRKEAVAVLDIAHSLGYKWTNGASFLNQRNFKCGDSTCYNLTEGLYDSINNYINLGGFDIMSAEAFLKLHGKLEEFKAKKNWDDLENVSGYFVSSSSGIEKVDNFKVVDENKNIATTEKHCKSMLAMAQISQLMPHYGGIVTDEEWKDHKVVKYIITRECGFLSRTVKFREYNFLAFHTDKQRDEFLKNNERLVKDYLMLD